MALEVFIQTCRTIVGQAPVAEYTFHHTRKWRFDYAFPHKKIAVEVEGGAWVNGRHNRASGFIKDMEKYNEAAILGWRIIRVTPDRLLKTQTFDLLTRILNDIK